MDTLDSQRDQLLHHVRHWQRPCPLIDVQRMLRVHRYTDPANVRPVIRQTAQAMAQLATTVASPRASWRRVSVSSILADKLILADGTTFRCQAFGRLLQRATEVVAFVITLGTPFDDAVCELIEKFEPLEALFLESAGWLAIERLSSQFGLYLRQELSAERLSLGLRMGPGYSYSAEGTEDGRVMWPLEQQKELFALFGGAKLPVELMQSCAMKPKMSRSGIFAVLPSEGAAGQPGGTGQHTSGKPVAPT